MRRFVFGLVLLILPACGSGDDTKAAAPPPIDPNAPVDASDFPGRYPVAFCTGLEACCTQNALTFDRAACEQQVQLDLGQWETYTTTPAYVYDGAAAASCLAALASRCPETNEPLADSACTGVVKGTVGIGGACDDPLACAAGGFCEEEDVDVTGTCVGTASGTAVGEACTDGATTCASGLVCDATGHCNAPKAEGEPCMDEADCGDGLFCNIEDGGFTCRALPAIGASCGVNGCAAGAYCDGSKTCVAVKAKGASCADDDECSPGHCIQGLCVDASTALYACGDGAMGTDAAE